MDVDLNTCLLALHGDYCPTQVSVAPEMEADLYSSFVSKAASLGWNSTYSCASSPEIWGMEDAFLEGKQIDEGLVAWVRVGLIDVHKSSPGSSGPLLPIAQCASEVVDDFGDFELKAAQVLVPLNAVTSDSVSLASLDTWMYPSSPCSARSLVISVWADVETLTISAGEAEQLLKSSYLSAMLDGIKTADDRLAGKSIASSSSIAEQLGFQQLFRATADVPRWGAKQTACIATAFALALGKVSAAGSIAVQIETLPN